MVPVLSLFHPQPKSHHFHPSPEASLLPVLLHSIIVSTILFYRLDLVYVFPSTIHKAYDDIHLLSLLSPVKVTPILKIEFPFNLAYEM